MMIVIGTLIAGMTTETLGQGQVIEWVVLNSLVFSCGVRCWTAGVCEATGLECDRNPGRADLIERFGQIYFGYPPT